MLKSRILAQEYLLRWGRETGPVALSKGSTPFSWGRQSGGSFFVRKFRTRLDRATGSGGRDTDHDGGAGPI